MAEQRNDGQKGPSVVLGGGKRPRTLGAVFAVLASLEEAEAEGRKGWDAITKRMGAFRPHVLEDVEELLIGRAKDWGESGTLILETLDVAPEDIGFVRRFLERHPAWHLFVLGEDSRDPSSRGLLDLPRARWLPWPPDLDQVTGLFQEGGRPPARESAEPVVTAKIPRPTPASEAIDLDDLLQECLTEQTLGTGAPRFNYQGTDGIRLKGNRIPVQRGIEGLLSLARSCAGSEGVVDVTTLGSGDGRGPRIRIDFPIGPLTDGDLPGLLEEAFQGAPELSDDVENARGGAGALQNLGARVDLLVERPGRLRFEVGFAARSGSRN